jgi:hypothetical protein
MNVNDDDLLRRPARGGKEPNRTGGGQKIWKTLIDYQTNSGFHAGIGTVSTRSSLATRTVRTVQYIPRGYRSLSLARPLLAYPLRGRNE